MPLEKGQYFEEERTDEKGETDWYFIQTDFDEKIEQFITTVINNGGTPISVNTIATNEHLIAFIQYSDMSPDEIVKAQQQSGKIIKMPDNIS
jgi:hypothetical protein